MSHPHDPDDDLRRLLADAVAEVTPHDRLGEIRRRTAPAATRGSRRWPLVAVAAGLATAAVVGAVAYVGGMLGQDAPVASSPRQAAVGTYFVGATDAGPRLFREFQLVPAGPDTERALAALQRLESDAGPADPDYTTAWPSGAFTGVTVADGGIEVGLGVDAVPGGLAVQQAVQTVQGVLQQVLPVTFTTASGPLAGASAVARDNTVSAPVNISDPVEGLVASGSLAVRGRVSPHRGPTSVAYELRDAAQDVQAAGTTPVADLAWTLTLDLSSLRPGTYTIAVWGADQDTGTDTRTITVR